MKILVVYFLFLFCCSLSVFASSVHNTCSDRYFTNSYYKIDLVDLHRVSIFFKQLSKLTLRGKDLRWSHQSGNRKQYYQYFDYPDKQLLKEKKELVFSLNKMLPTYREDRYRISFRHYNKKTIHTQQFKVKNYNRKVSSLDIHPLFSHVRRKDRDSLQKIAAVPGHHPEELLSSIEVESEEKVFLLSHYGIAKSEITLEQIHIMNYGLNDTITFLNFELYKQPDINLKLKEIKQIKNVLCQIKKQFQQQFSSLDEQFLPKYTYYDKIVNKSFPIRKWYEKYPLLYKLGQALILSIIGYLFLYLVVRHYSYSTNYRRIEKKGSDNAYKKE